MPRQQRGRSDSSRLQSKTTVSTSPFICTASSFFLFVCICHPILLFVQRIMVSSKDVEIFREDARLRGKKLSAAEREELLKPYLPEPSSEMKTKSKTKSKAKQKPRHTPIRSFLKQQIHRLVYVVIHLCLGFYIRISQTFAAVTDRVLAVTYYHHRSPELIARDVKGLSRMPEHLSVLLKLRKREEDALQTLMDETAELAAWTACAGIPVLSVYERTGRPSNSLDIRWEC